MKKKSKPVQEKKTVRERLANTLDASKEVVLDVPRLTFIGNRELMVENYKSIGEYTEKKIILETNPHRLVVDGAGLEIRSMAKELIYITGQIQCVSFRREV
jgi:sporulation protein YqfC